MTILNFLRDGTTSLPDNNKRELIEILTEAKYFLIQELIDLIEIQLNRLRFVLPLKRCFVSHNLFSILRK